MPAPLAALLLALCAPLQAAPYLDAAVGVEAHRQATSLAIGVARGDWFLQVVKPFFADVPELEFIRDDGIGPGGLGGGETLTWESRQGTRTKAVAIEIGKIFPLGGISIGPFVGAHRYRQTVTGVSRLVRIDQATNEEIIDRTVYTDQTRAGWAAAFGAQVTVPIASNLSMLTRITQYQTIDRRTVDFGLRLEF